jgi:cytochrome c-type biogenesis protein CcmH/NrfG
MRNLRGACLLVFLAAVAAYAPKLGNHFTFDDRVFLVTNPQIRTLSAALTEFTTDQARLYRPVRSVAEALVVTAFGLDDAAPYHAAGILFHAALAALVCLIVWLLFGDRSTALIAGLIFALHPAHADRVANVTGSFDLLGLALAYGAWAAALVYARTGRRGAAWHAGWLFALGCFGSEETLTVWPLVLGSVVALPREARSRLARLAVVLLLPMALYLGARFWVLSGVARTATYAAGSFAATLWTMPVVIARYLGLLVWPVGLTPAYGPTIYPSPGWTPIIAWAGLLALAATSLAAWRRAPWWTLAVAWFFAALVPFGNLLPSDTLMAERYLYAALGGFALAAGCGAAWLVRQRQAARPALIAILALFTVGTVARCLVWGTPLILWGQAATREPDSFLANLNAGYHHLVNNRLGDAARFAQRAHRLNGQRPEPLMQLGDLAMRRNEPAQALPFFAQAVRADGRFCPAHAALAQGFMAVNDYARAGEAALDAVKCDFGNTLAHYVLAALAVHGGQCDLARRSLDVILATQPPPQEYGAAVALKQQCAEAAVGPGGRK